MSNDVAISVENLGKSYRLRHAAKRATTFAGAVKSAASAPFKYLGEKMRAADESEIFWALKDVSFEVKKGEIVGLIGKNGAGKSTLLKILSRITDPTNGRARVMGHLNSLLEVGTGFHPELTGRENIYLSAVLHGVSRAEVTRKFDEIVAFSEVEKFLDTPVKRYSSGMYVRLGFAVAAHLEPDILIVDEVLAVGDVDFQRKCMGKMGEITNTGRTVLLVSHNMTTVKSFCTRGIVLEKGQVVCDSNADEAVSRYLKGGRQDHSDGVIPNDVPRIGNGDALLRSVHITTSGGEPRNQLYYRQPFRVVLGFDVFNEIKDGIVNVNIAARDGSRLCHATTGTKQAELLEIKPGRYEISVDIRTVLLPNNYTLNLGISRRFGRSDVDLVEQAFDFEVLNVAEKGEDNFPWTDHWHGFVLADAEWRAPERVGDVTK